MSTVFTKIINGEIPCHKIAETENYFAFLDTRPLAKGHTLVIPKKEVDYLFDLDEEEFIGLQLFARYIAISLKEAIPCLRVGVAVLGLEVPHAHIHLVPLQSEGDLNFSNNRLTFSKQEFAKIAEEIRAKVPT